MSRLDVSQLIVPDILIDHAHSLPVVVDRLGLELQLGVLRQKNLSKVLQPDAAVHGSLSCLHLRLKEVGLPLHLSLHLVGAHARRRRPGHRAPDLATISGVSVAYGDLVGCASFLDGWHGVPP